PVLLPQSQDRHQKTVQKQAVYTRKLHSPDSFGVGLPSAATTARLPLPPWTGQNRRYLVRTSSFGRTVGQRKTVRNHSTQDPLAQGTRTAEYYRRWHLMTGTPGPQ